METEQETKTEEQKAGEEQTAAELQEERLEAQRRARVEIGQFVALFPGVSAEQVPQEVWQEVHGGQSLALAYALHRIKTLEETLELQERRMRNARLSAGSVSSAGSAALGGTVASFWDAYEV